ncbi:hypothetical protein S245_041280 [Arachis hypogaea]
MGNLVCKPLEKVVDLLLEASIRQLDYIINYEDHVKNIKELDDKLEKNELTVKHLVDTAKNNAEEITPTTEGWLKEVSEKREESKEFHDDKILRSKTSCFSGGCSSGALPFLWHRRQLGRKAKKILAPNIDNLNKEFSKVTKAISGGPKVLKIADSNLCGGSYHEFESRKGIIDKIMEKLKDSRVRMVGVHGPSGVGKTSLLYKIAEQATCNTILFDKVAWATVKKDPDLRKVQQDIADHLGLTFANEGDDRRAARLRDVLTQKNTLVILDDLWDELDLNKIGIPFDDDNVSSDVMHNQRKEATEQRVKNENSPGNTKGCKILVTSRFEEVLRVKMNVKSTFLVTKLNPGEASALFTRVVGIPNENPELSDMLDKYCAGLPMLVLILGKSLRNKSESELKDELQRLGNQEPNEAREDMENYVKKNYDHLASEELKFILLVSAQISHQSLIADLVKYCYGLGILKGVHTLREAHDRISKSSINKLKDSGLMLDCNSIDHFGMHDIVRDAALSIACKERKVFISRNEKLDFWPDKKQLQRLTGIHLYKSHIMVELPKVLNCPQLKFFHIDNDDPSLQIPDRFFERMEDLRVLVLSGIHLSNLPSSIECLANLRMLCLEKCTLGNLSIINKLKNLRILSLSGSRIEDWLTELECLCKLQLLDISDCFINRFTRPLALSSFTSLEELHIRNSLTKLDVEKEVSHSQISILSEVKHLHELNTIDVCIPNAEFLPTDLFFHELNDYKIVIGDFETLSTGDFKMPNKYETSRSLALQLEPEMDIHSLKGVKLLFKGVENLLLGDLHGVQNAFYELNLDGFPYLKHLSIVNNKDIEYIVNSMELSQPQDVFPNLEFLSLFNLTNIKKICCSPVTDSSFSRLKTIKVKMCPQLKSIFFLFIVKFLTSLETIDVSKCDSLEAIVREEGEGSNNKVEFHKLCSLALQDLPSFVSFYNINDREIVPATDEQSATTSFSLFNENVEIPNLETLKLFSIKIHKIWSNPPSSSWFHNLIKLTMEDCCNLTYLCSLSVACNLNKLKSISISRCPLMEKLFITEGKKNEYAKVRILPELEEIQLSGMEILKDIWPHEDEVSADSFPSLISVDIRRCDKLEIIFPNHTKCWYLHLKSLKVHGCMSVEFIFKIRGSSQQNDTNKSALLEVIDLGDLPYLKQVWSEDSKGVVNFTNLQSIEISSCKTLSNVLQASIAKDLGKLESFSIEFCDNLEEIIACDGGSETTLKFPEVVSMSFRNLPRIRCLYKGRHIVECPKLKQLTVTACPNLEIFKTESANEQERAFLSAEKVMSNLEHLTIDSKGVEWLLSNTRKYLFTSLKQLTIFYSWQSHHDQTLYCFLHTIPNLQILYLGYDSNIREFVPSGNTAAKQRLGTVLLLKELTLNAWKMEDIGFERDPALQRSLHRLILLFCYKLKRLAHSSVSFTHLTYLEVYYCHELKTLMTCSTAKSLVQLTTLKVKKCDQLNEIVTQDEQENDEGIKIVFANLINIELKDLTNLTSFCSNSNCEFSVPLLEKLTLTECPKMKTFTAKHITAPKLQSVLASEEEKGYWKGDLNATIQMYKVPLELSNHPNLKQVWCDKTVVQVNKFENVKSLVVKRCGYLVHVIPSHLLHCFKNLEYLQVSDCDGVRVIFNMDESNNKQVTKAMGLSRLKKLSLKNLPNLEHVWDIDSIEIIHFSALQDLSIDKCDSLKYVFPTSIAEDLAMLNNLSVEHCEKMVKIFAEDKRTSELGDTKTFELPSLTSLVLRELPMLKHFYPGLQKLQFPKLKELYIHVCKWMILSCQEAKAFVDQQVLLPIEQVNLLFQSLEKLSFDMRGAKLTWEVKSRKLEFEKSEEERVEEVVFEEKPKADDVELLSHLDLKGLRLHALDGLKSIGLEHSWIHPILDNIQTLKVKYCHHIKNLVASKVSFSSLTKLVVSGCDGLLYVFTSSTAESLSQLKHMEISNCDSMREIICKEDDESNENIIFKQLKVLHLEELPMLRWLYSGKRTLYFPALQHLSIFGHTLWRMTTFCPHFHIMNLNSLKLRSGRNKYDPYEVQWEADVDTTIRKMNNKKIGLRESLYFQDMWRGSMPIPEAYFGNLESLIVHQCEFLSEVIPLHLLPSLNNMRTLKVQKCSSVKTIFDVKCITKNKTLLPIKFSLKELVLEKLPNLDSIWNEDPDGVLDFQLIQEMHVDTCKSLTSLFPKSVGKDLVNLKNLELKHCEGLVEIIAGIETTPEEAISNLIKLPRLTSLTLLDLPSFNCFYCSLHCVLMKTLNGHDPQIEDQVSFKEVTPKLTNMLFGEREAKMIGHEECDGSHFGDINVPDMQSFNVELESDELPYTFLQKVSCIKTLQLKNSSIKEIFCSKRPNLDCTQFLPHLKELKLASLSELISIGFECSWILESSILKTLVTLEVKSCSGLTSLVSSPVCFSNLTHLTVSECDSMIYLFTSATAKSLFQLKEMKISNCKSMEWIMSNEGEESIHDEIVFEQLQELRFESLKNLRRFYNGDFALSFPSLEKLKVIKCNRMEYFCEGTINTNKLSEVVFDDSFRGDRTPLEVDLNSTLRNTYKTEVAKFVREVKDLKLSEHPMIHGIWNDPFRVPSLCFIRLKILIVEKCEFITSIVIPSHILSLLCKLEELVVRQCDSVKKIFEVTHEAKDTMINPLRSGLKKLTIEQLPNLEHVWDSDPAQQISYFQSFQEVYVHGCNNLQRLFPTSVAENLNKLEKLEVIECDRLVEIVTKDEVVVEGAPKEFALQSMTSIKLWSLPELKCFYPAPHKLECPKLEEVHLFHCEKLKIFQFESQEFQCPQAENEAIFLPEKVIPYLKFLAVSKEEIMMMLHGQFHVNNLSKLEALQLQCFHDDSDTFSYEVLGQLPNIENLAVNCSSFKEIFYSQSPNMDDGKGILPHLKCLQLIKLSKLKSIGLEYAWMDLISKNLEKLLIDQCHCLRSIVPSKVSFSSLIELNISECNGLVSLFTPSTSRTLHQLKNMSVKDCESLEEIVSKETEESSELVEEEIIVFPELKTLSLCSLPNLGRFYNGNTALKFPLLDKFSLIDCQKMESFCAGAVSVNRWTEVEFEEDKDPVLLEVDLNSAIPKAFEGMFY